VGFARETYGGDIWHKALDMMQEIRARTSIQKISGDYAAFLNRIQDG
jgi:hypothetical protein